MGKIETEEGGRKERSRIKMAHLQSERTGRVYVHNLNGEVATRAGGVNKNAGRGAGEGAGQVSRSVGLHKKARGDAR